MGTGFDALAAAGAANAERQGQQRSALDMMQRKFLADQYANVAAQPLPDIASDPEGHQKALDARAKALEMQQKIYSPDHHASLADHLHGLIFGKPADAQQQTPLVSSQAPQMPVAKDPLGVPYAAAATPEPPAHPFANHPEYAGIMGKIKELGSGIKNHLEAAAHPLPPKDAPDWKALAAASTPEEREAATKAGDAETRQKNALALESAKAKDAQILAGLKKKPILKAYKLADGTTQWLDASDPEKLPAGSEAISLTGQPKTSQAALATYIRAKYGENPTWQQIAEGTAEHQKLMSGVTVGEHQTVQFDDQGVPHVITLHSSSQKDYTPPGGNPPASSKAPQVPSSASPGARTPGTKPAGGAKKTPVSAHAPQVPSDQLNFRKATPAGTKAKEAVDTAENSYLDVQKASQDPTPVGDQGVILAWLRGRVNRVTQSEIASVNNLGGARMKLEGDIVRIETGKMTDQQRKWFLRSAKDNYDNARTVAAKYSVPVSSQAPQVPGSDDLADRLSKALEGK